MPRVLHILPHRGGGGETVVKTISSLNTYEHDFYYLADSRKAHRAVPSLMRGLSRLRHAVKPVDLVHVSGDTPILLTDPLLHGSPTVWSTQGLHLLRRSQGIQGKLVRNRLRLAITRTRRTICSSHSEFIELGEVAPDAQAKLVEVPNGIEIPAMPTCADRAVARRELGLDDEQVVALYLGELEPRKRPFDAITAVQDAAKAGSPVILLIAGQGPLEGEIAAEANEVVRVLGFRSDPAHLLTAADILLMPSEREGLALAVLEAMAYGLAVIASDGPGNPDAIGGAGLIHRTGDVKELSVALKRLAGSRDERERLGRAARARVEEEFTIDRFLANIDSAFSSAVSHSTIQ